jgi:hypothetical protein
LGLLEWGWVLALKEGGFGPLEVGMGEGAGWGLGPGEGRVGVPGSMGRGFMSEDNCLSSMHHNSSWYAYSQEDVINDAPKEIILNTYQKSN